MPRVEGAEQTYVVRADQGKLGFFCEDFASGEVMVVDVDPGSPAAQAGVQAGRLVALHGQAIVSSQHASDVIASIKMQGMTEFTMTVAPTISTEEPGPGMTRVATKPRTFVVGNPTDGRKCGFTLGETDEGPVITMISAEGLFADAGVCVGRLLAINDQPVFTVHDVTDLIEMCTKLGNSPSFTVTVLPTTVDDHHNKRPLGRMEFWVEASKSKTPFWGINAEPSRAGVVLEKILDDGLFKAANVPRGILVEVNGKPVQDIDALPYLLAEAQECGRAFFSVKVVPNPAQSVTFNPRVMKPTNWDAFLEYWEAEAEEELKTL
eukprot:TRINITY_DN23559_c0_g1_i1.p2 TRINITY_DN23559_c0_g1~~TRINITY_DN23559_c0_g1_i1.p2  ORF type:complete len:342 (+),score=135.60 TRINITY_DN23559_c0_g1_i1:64-1026(+)